MAGMKQEMRAASRSCKGQENRLSERPRRHSSAGVSIFAQQVPHLISDLQSWKMTNYCYVCGKLLEKLWKTNRSS